MKRIIIAALLVVSSSANAGYYSDYGKLTNNYKSAVEMADLDVEYLKNEVEYLCKVVKQSNLKEFASDICK